MLRMLHLADLHLGWTPRDWPTERARRRRTRRDRVLERAVEYALDHEIHLVVIAGDLFETYAPPADLVHSSIAQLRRLDDAGVTVVTVPGNHDELTYPDSVYRAHAERWPGVLVTSPTPQRLGPIPTLGGDVAIVSLAYVGGVTPARSPLNDFPDRAGGIPHVAAFHGTLGSGLGERSLPLDAQALGSKGYDYVALGHIHKPAVARLGSTPAVYPGCVEGKGFDDPGVPSWTVVTLGAGDARIEHVPVDIQTIDDLELDVTQFDTVDEIRERIQARQDADAIQRVTLTGSLHVADLDPDALAAEFAPHFFHFELRDRTTSVAAELLERWAQEPTVRGAFVQRMRERLEAAASDDERTTIVRALRYGVRALQGSGR